MCVRTTCRGCGKPTWSGCGAHAEQVLAGVPKSERCRCREEGKTGAAQPSGGGFWSLFSRGTPKGAGK